jgi:O-methyltransferase
MLHRKSSDALKAAAKERTPKFVLCLYRVMRRLSLGDALASWRFAVTPLPSTSLRARLRMLQRFWETTIGVECAHTQAEMLSFATAILRVPAEVDGCVVEAGSFKGGGTAKFSAAAKLAGRRLVIFDSFEGMPHNVEPRQETIFGKQTEFSQGKYRGGLEEVQHNVATFGDPDVCAYTKGWFEDTMPNFRQAVVAAYLDVDLVSSTRVCLKYLYPLLQPGGYLFSQDAHLPLIIELLQDAAFWKEELGCGVPVIQGLGRRKLVYIRKPL